METNLEKVSYLCSRLIQAVRDNDKNSVKFHLEDLNNLIQEKHLGAE